MIKSERLLTLSARVEYYAGTRMAAMLVRRFGFGSQVHFSVKYWSPSKIVIGSRCEIRHGTFLDARSSKDVAIHIDDGTRIKDYVGLAAYGGEIYLGKNVLVGRCSTIFGHGGVYVGDNAMLSPHTTLVSSNHIAYLCDIPFQEQGFTREPIVISENVWIGANVCVLAGSSIAPNTVIAAGSVVTGKLDGGWVYGGVPAKPIVHLDNCPPEDRVIYRRNWDLFRTDMI